MSSLFLVLLLLSPLLSAANKQTAEAYFSSLADAQKAPYKTWLDSNFGTYSRHSFLPSTADPAEGAAVFWIVEGDDIQFAVAAKASGWLGFGISEAGGMLGADIATFSTSSPSELVDSYTLESRALMPDDCNNWILVSSDTTDGWIILEMKRALDTGDAQDHKILYDKDLWIPPTRLIAAWGDSSSVGYHGLNRARNSVRIFDDSSDSSLSLAEVLGATLESNSDGFFEVREDNYQIPATDTEYHYRCRTASSIRAELNLGDDTVTAIGAVPVISPETIQFVHHFTVYLQKDCSFTVGDKSMVYAWAPGDEGWSLPDDVGFPLFDADNHQALMVEIHYNNPGRVSGQLDSSGIRFYYSKTARTHDAAVLELGDPLLRLDGEKIDDGLTNYEFSCGSGCSSTFLGGSSGVTVLAEYLHMHQTGVRMTNEVTRNGQVYHKAAVDVFEFAQQGSFKVQQDSYQFMPGDSFKTSCYFRDGNKFGLSSQEEMCIAYVLYYPAKQFLGFPWLCPYGLDLPLCNQEMKATPLSSDAELGRTFGSSGSTCNLPTSKSPTPKPSTLLPTTMPTKSSSSPTLHDPTTDTTSPTNTILPVPTKVTNTSPTLLPTTTGTPTSTETSSSASGKSWSFAALLLGVAFLPGVVADLEMCPFRFIFL